MTAKLAARPWAKSSIHWRALAMAISSASRQPFDLAILIASALNDPTKLALFTDPRTPVSSVGLGAAVRAGAPKPDLADTHDLFDAEQRMKAAKC
jgi:hypothetical protein